MSHADPAPIEELLAHDGWVRNLAVRLVRDGSDADDLAQDTWAAALRSPPRDRSTIRAWLATVMRNRAHERRRSSSRREARESVVARPDRTAAAAEIVARADAHRHVVTTVLTLEEPYRSTVLLLFFEGLTPSEVGRRLSVPVDTVRTRARRALETLRARLDRDHGGDRRAWVVAVLGPEAWTRWGAPTVGVSARRQAAYSERGL